MGMWLLVGGQSKKLKGKTLPETSSDKEIKLQELQNILSEMGSVLISYSGGVDSTFLLKVARDVLGDNVIAVTARSLTYPIRELEEAKALASNLRIRHLIIDSEEIDIPGFSHNPPDRCYYCKRELFSKLKEIARQEGMDYVADGCNLDDINDFRPGTKAAEEAGVRSPLKEAELTKDNIRGFSEQLGLPTWDKPSIACLASRFPYGDAITAEGLKMVGEAEEYLYGLGFKQLRVRHHKDMARIEVPTEDFERFFEDDLRKEIVRHLKEVGYNYVTLDLQGYRTGSMNEVLDTTGDLTY